MSEHHNEHSVDQHHDQPHEEAHKPSAPPADENGFIVVPQSVAAHAEHIAEHGADEINKILDDISSTINKEVAAAAATRTAEPVKQEPAPAKQPEPVKPEAPKTEPAKPAPTSAGGKSCSSDSTCSLCPYYLLGWNCLNKIQLPPKVKDLILWKDPKVTGAVFGTELVLLLSLATFSFFSVVGTLLLLALTVAGFYRLYLSIVFRIKGTYDDTFDKASAFDLSLPKDKVQELAHLLETDVNKVLNKLKSIILWDNVTTSALAFIGFYVIYCVGSIFNTLTLLTILHIGLFTLPKIYQVYQKPIDQAIQKVTDVSHNIARQISAKLPFLHKKKTQ